MREQWGWQPGCTAAVGSSPVIRKRSAALRGVAQSAHTAWPSSSQSKFIGERSVWALSDWKLFSFWAPWRNKQDTKAGRQLQPKCWRQGKALLRAGPQRSTARTRELQGSLCLLTALLTLLERGQSCLQETICSRGCHPPPPATSPSHPTFHRSLFCSRAAVREPIQPGIWNQASQTARLGQMVPPSILELGFREFWFYLYRS